MVEKQIILLHSVSLCVAIEMAAPAAISTMCFYYVFLLWPGGPRDAFLSTSEGQVTPFVGLLFCFILLELRYILVF